MAEPGRRLATYADLGAVPPNLVAEIIYGSLVTQRFGEPRAAAARCALSASLKHFARESELCPPNWIFLVGPECKFHEHILVPDLAGWRRQNLPALPADNPIAIRPDWIAEIMTDETAELDAGSKREVYATFGLPHLWLIDIRSRNLEALELSSANWRSSGTVSAGDEVRFPPFDAISFPLDHLWPLDVAVEQPHKNA